MILVKHRFLDHKINPLVETLVIGTFNPETPSNNADFFYSRQVKRPNGLWKLLPLAFGREDLRGLKRVEEKKLFMEACRVDFIDLISAVRVEKGKENNYYDRYIDGRISEWRDVTAEIAKLNSLKRVCFTRKGLADIPNMANRIVEIAAACEIKGVRFSCIISPARYYSPAKQDEWTRFMSL